MFSHLAPAAVLAATDHSRTGAPRRAIRFLSAAKLFDRLQLIRASSLRRLRRTTEAAESPQLTHNRLTALCADAAAAAACVAALGFYSLQLNPHVYDIWKPRVVSLPPRVHSFLTTGSGALSL